MPAKQVCEGFAQIDPGRFAVRSAGMAYTKIKNEMFRTVARNDNDRIVDIDEALKEYHQYFDVPDVPSPVQNASVSRDARSMRRGVWWTTSRDATWTRTWCMRWATVPPSGRTVTANDG